MADQTNLDATTIAQRRFSLDDARRFAAATGDRNPLHIDPVAARRTSFGEPVVHGMHAVLWALDTFAAHGRCVELAALTVSFVKPILVGDHVTLRLGERRADGAELCADVDATVVIRIAVNFGRRAPATAAAPPKPAADGSLAARASAAEPADPQFEELTGRAGFVVPGSVSDLFPAAAQVLGTRAAAGLGALSTVVGMEVPGRYSLFAGLAVNLAGAADAAPLGFEVTTADARYRRVTIAVWGAGLAGTLDAFALPKPVAQPAYADVAAAGVPAHPTADVALVAGGSRGLGELCAKLVAAAGAQVIVTYHRGERDAARVAAEIIAGGGRASVIRYDVTEPAGPQLATFAARPTHLWYFATPPIFRLRRDPFDPERFAEFVRYYVTGFAELCGTLAADGPLAAFYPSTTAIDERPRGMTEYAAAKAAGELLCSDLTRLLPALRIVQRRLPRLPTDQTASVFRSALEDAPALFAPIVAEMHAPAAPRGASGECVRSRELA